MKRANVLRLVAILAVVVLASMTAGCLKASISLEVVLDPEEYTVGENLKGEATVVATGLAKGGVYHTLTVDFLDTGSPVNVLDTVKKEDLNVVIKPWDNNPISITLDDLELTVPEDAGGAADARFTLTGDGLGLVPITVTVKCIVAEPLP